MWCGSARAQTVHASELTLCHLELDGIAPPSVHGEAWQSALTNRPVTGATEGRIPHCRTMGPLCGPWSATHEADRPSVQRGASSTHPQRGRRLPRAGRRDGSRWSLRDVRHRLGSDACLSMRPRGRKPGGRTARDDVVRLARLSGTVGTVRIQLAPSTVYRSALFVVRSPLVRSAMGSCRRPSRRCRSPGVWW